MFFSFSLVCSLILIPIYVFISFFTIREEDPRCTRKSAAKGGPRSPTPSHVKVYLVGFWPRKPSSGPGALYLARFHAQKPCSWPGSLVLVWVLGTEAIYFTRKHCVELNKQGNLLSYQKLFYLNRLCTCKLYILPRFSLRVVCSK